MSSTDTPIDPPPPTTPSDDPGRPPLEVPDQPSGEEIPVGDPSPDETGPKIAADDAGASALAEQSQEQSS